MFGMLEAMLSFLRRQIGLRTDAANAAGSLHAKINELRSYISTNYIKNKNATWYTHIGGTAIEETEVTLFSVTGSGLAWFQPTITITSPSNNGNSMVASFRIYVNGSQLYNIDFGTIGGNGASKTMTGFPPIIRFTSSFAVKTYADVANSTGYQYKCSYGLTCMVE